MFFLIRQYLLLNFYSLSRLLLFRLFQNYYGNITFDEENLLEISEKDVVKAAFIAYIFPPILMILGYIVADRLGFSEMQSIAGSFIGLVIGFIFLAIYDRFFAKKTIDEEIK